MTHPHEPHPADAMLDHLGAVITARQTGHHDIAGDLLNAMVTDSESAFRVMLMLAQIAAMPGLVAREQLEQMGLPGVDIVPDTELVTEDESAATRMVIAMVKRDRPAAFDIAMGVLDRTAMEPPGPGGRRAVHRVVAALVDICAQGGPDITAVPEDMAKQYAKREMN